MKERSVDKQRVLLPYLSSHKHIEQNEMVSDCGGYSKEGKRLRHLKADYPHNY